MMETAIIGRRTQTIHLGTRLLHERAILKPPRPIVRGFIAPQFLTPVGAVFGGTVEAVFAA
jgi:hypothetical protein